MALLLVRRGKKSPFHPRLRLESTGYCPRGHWTAVMFHPGASVGLRSIYELPTIADAVRHYFAELKRTGHEVFTGN